MRALLKGVLRARRPILFYGLLLTFGLLLGAQLRDFAFPEMRQMNEPFFHRMVTGALLAFVVTAAIPFVPGAEIGFGLLLIFGGEAAPIVYVGMVSALFLSYTIGRIVPPTALIPALEWLGLCRVATLTRVVTSAPPEARAGVLAAHLPRRAARICVGNRYVLLAILINLPGNTLLGGGGGLAFAAGLSRVFGALPFVVTTALAVAPIPLIFWLMQVFSVTPT